MWSILYAHKPCFLMLGHILFMHVCYTDNSSNVAVTGAVVGSVGGVIIIIIIMVIINVIVWKLYRNRHHKGIAKYT